MNQQYSIDKLFEQYNSYREERRQYKGENIDELIMIYEKEVEVLRKIKKEYKEEIRNKLDELKKLNKN